MLKEPDIRAILKRTEKKEANAYAKMNSLGTHKKRGEIATHTIEYFVFRGAIKAFKLVLSEGEVSDL